jgi:pectinesterase
VGLSNDVQAIDEAQKEYDEGISWHLQRSDEQLSFLDKKDEINRSGNNVSSTQLERKIRQAEKNKREITVCQDGKGDFLTIKDAVLSIDANSIRKTVIYIRAGIYKEKVLVPRSKPFVTFMGDDARPPVITGNDTAAAIGMDGLPLKTFSSATVAVNSDYFIAYNIRFENTTPHPETGSNGGQAVALRISGTKTAFYNCSFYGAQDTLATDVPECHLQHCSFRAQNMFSQCLVARQDDTQCQKKNQTCG